MSHERNATPGPFRERYRSARKPRQLGPKVHQLGPEERWVTVAEIGGHARIDTLRIYIQPTDEDKFAALDHLTGDR